MIAIGFVILVFREMVLSIVILNVQSSYESKGEKQRINENAY